MSESLILLIYFLPLLGVVFNALGYAFWPTKLIKRLATLMMAGAFASAAYITYLFFQLPAAEQVITQNVWNWIEYGTFKISLGYLIDPLSLLMVVMITGISFLIHLYSLAYMEHEEGQKRYFIFLSLFTLSMLVLVTAPNFLQMFLGWEGVGLCSYLLIGHYFQKPSAAGAAKKAFVVNRIGDLGLIIAIALIAIQFNSLDFATVFGGIKNNFLAGDWLMTTLAALMFLAVIGKSAQFPLHVWLPDAMEGPTPVSALIHAATMVTAGIFLMIRASVIFQLAPLVLTIISIVGCITALGAALLAMVQYDLKKVLAYSTVSQLGYMALACGVGAYSAAFFHLLTHAFFKAVLFLGAGSVIYALHHEQDMRKMGGLYKKMPVTFVTFLIGALALSGFPGTAGFFSKDEILAQSFLSPNGHFLFWAVGLITAGLTAFYMFRALTMVFLRKNNSELIEEAKESPWQMGLPLIILAIGSLIVGYINIPRSLGGSLWLEHFLEPAFKFVHEEIPFIQTIPDYGMEHFLLGLTTVVVLYLLFIGIRFYRTKPEIPKKVSARFPSLTKILKHQYYLDAFYYKAIVQPGKKLSHSLERFNHHADLWVDRSVDRLNYLSTSLSKVASGDTGQYLIYFGIGTVVLLFILLVRS